MTTIVTRAGKGSPLTHTEVDTNFTNLNTNKLETAAIPLGTLAAPSISFLSDANTGIYSPAADTVAFVTAGSNRVHITSGGLVGIGTSSPSRRLHVSVAGTGNVATFESDSGPNLAFVGTEASGRTYLIGEGLTAAGLFQIYDNNASSARLTINSSGSVGIGSNAPQALCHVYGGASSNTLPNNAQAIFEYSANGGIAISVPTANVAGLYFPRSTDAYYAGIERNGTDLTFRNNGSTKATIDSSGRLLIGTSTHQGDYTLQIQGDATSANAAGCIYLRRGLNTAAIGGNVGADLGDIQFGANDGTVAARIECLSDAAWSSTSDCPGRLVFSTTADGGSSPTERMRISNYGRIDMRTDTGSFGGTGIPTLGLFQSGDTTLTQYLIYGAHSATGYSGTNCFIVLNNGNVSNTNNSYGAISDIKLKENIIDASSQWADLKALRVRKYNFREETGQQTHTQIGLVAQEVELVSPGLVNESPDRDAEGNDLGTVTKGVNYSVLYMKAVKALQEAMERIEQLEARLTAAGIE